MSTATHEKLTDDRRRLEDLQQEEAELQTALSSDSTVEEVIQNQARLTAIQTLIPILKKEIARPESNLAPQEGEIDGRGLIYPRMRVDETNLGRRIKPSEHWGNTLARSSGPAISAKELDNLAGL